MLSSPGSGHCSDSGQLRWFRGLAAFYRLRGERRANVREQANLFRVLLAGN